ncbi:hypothetical protein [Vitreimonas flagellata]|uniref:hypothetical protein n=1 Tax=Vitreimonas flagellata TaxID=2560861 RepID=UPI001074C8C8|nr:hypothetical protein [Vitreimonas flagellata]
MTVDVDKVLDAWSAGEPASSIAARFECSDRNIYRIAQKARDDGDARGEFPSHSVRELYAAAQIKDRAAELYRKGLEVSIIADKLGVDARIIRAAVYLATKDGINTGLGFSTGGGVEHAFAA